MICIGNLETGSLDQSVFIAEDVSAQTDLTIRFWSEYFTFYPGLLQYEAFFQHSCLPAERKGPWRT
jgi:hypothetical protein